MATKVSVEDLSAYVNTAQALAENITQDIARNDREISDETVQALHDFLDAMEQMDYVIDSLNGDKRQLN